MQTMMKPSKGENGACVFGATPSLKVKTWPMLGTHCVHTERRSLEVRLDKSGNRELKDCSRT
jgi:hypothetical protein